MEFNAPSVITSEVPYENFYGLYLKLSFSDDSLLSTGRTSYRSTPLAGPYLALPPPLPGPSLISIEARSGTSSGTSIGRYWDTLNYGLSRYLGSAYIGYTSTYGDSGTAIIDIQMSTSGNPIINISLNSSIEDGGVITSGESASTAFASVYGTLYGPSGGGRGTWTIVRNGSTSIPAPSSLLLLLACLIPLGLKRVKQYPTNRPRLQNLIR
jgi:hypothetical protein